MVSEDSTSRVIVFPVRSLNKVSCIPPTTVGLNQVESGFFLDCCSPRESSAIFQLLPSENQSSVGQEGFLQKVLKIFCFTAWIVSEDSYFKSDSFIPAFKVLTIDLHTSTKSENQVESGFFFGCCNQREFVRPRVAFQRKINRCWSGGIPSLS